MARKNSRELARCFAQDKREVKGGFYFFFLSFFYLCCGKNGLI
jgi:hypothetical protein